MNATKLDWRPQGETVLGVWAHPDDEAYLSAGLMARTIRSGGTVACVHATRGEHGTPDPDRLPPERLARLRTDELAASLGLLGVDEYKILGYPDGGCSLVQRDEVITFLTGVLRSLRPDLVVTFGPDGITGHADHVAVSRWITTAWQIARQGRLLYAVSTTSFLRRFADVHARLGLLPAQPAAVPDEQVALSIHLTRTELDLKRAALAAHASQTDVLAAAMGEYTYRHWYDVETFRAPTTSELADAATAGAAP